MPTNGLFNFTDTNALAVTRFYRVTTSPDAQRKQLICVSLAATT